MPEVLQSALMDCGPAALKAVAEGFGVDVSYDEVRRRCQTDVDGTSIDALSSLGRELSLDCHQVLVPHEHFLLPDARCLPAIVVTRVGSGPLHFLVVWRKLGPFVEVMDPAAGRRWVRARHLLADMPYFSLPIGAAHWRRWAASARALASWRARLRRLGVPPRAAQRLLDAAVDDPTWNGFARLDAALRLAATLVRDGGLRAGREATQVILRMMRASSGLTIPSRFFWVVPALDDSRQLVARGSVIVVFTGRVAGDRGLCCATHEDVAPTDTRTRDARVRAESVLAEPRSSDADEPLPMAVRRALGQPSWRPLGVLWVFACERARWRLAWVLVALLASAFLVPVEAIALRGLVDTGQHRALGYQQAGWLLALAVPFLLGLVLEHWVGGWAASLGRDLETRLRAALFQRLPQLGDDYVRSRPSSDIAGRGQSVHLVRVLPVLWVQLVRSTLTLAVTGWVLVWLFGAAGGLVATLIGVSLTLPVLARRGLVECNIRLQTQASELDRFFLDALRGVVPIRTHGAERALTQAHEERLAEWAQTSRRFHFQHTLARAVQTLVTTLVLVGLVVRYLELNQTQGLLLLLVLVFRLPAAADELSNAALALGGLKALALRVLAPLAAASGVCEARAELERIPPPQAGGVSLLFESVTVAVVGRNVLEGVSLHVPAGQHVAIVGSSGAGKSSLLGLLLGWLEPSSGRIEVDGQRLAPARVAALRRQTAWVDPAVTLWDDSLLENLTYGDADHLEEHLPKALSAADLEDVLQHLPDGLQSGLGEGGVRLSGGQGQRVRLGRALMRPNPRLVLLDEPFRGLTRDQRSRLMRRVREKWPNATLLFASHDLADTVELDQVLVLEGGRLVETGAPAELLRDPCSRYSSLLTTSRAVRRRLWQGEAFRRLVLEGGRIQEVDTPCPVAGGEDRGAWTGRN